MKELPSVIPENKERGISPAAPQLVDFAFMNATAVSSIRLLIPRLVAPAHPGCARMCLRLNSTASRS
jgi:hypothetical protein